MTQPAFGWRLKLAGPSTLRKPSLWRLAAATAHRSSVASAAIGGGWSG